MLQKRKVLRLAGYNYAKPGAYFITICTHGQKSFFGMIEDRTMNLNDYGRIVEKCWFNLPDHYPNIQLGEWIIMPNHIHGIIEIVTVGAGSQTLPIVGAGLKPAPTKKHHGIPEIVRAFKTFSSRRINELRNTPGTPVWQRNYFEHIIRNKKSMQQISNYIRNNPLHWSSDDQCKPDIW